METAQDKRPADQGGKGNSASVPSEYSAGSIKVLETNWLVNGERWVYRRYPELNVTLHRFSEDAASP